MAKTPQRDRSATTDPVRRRIIAAIAAASPRISLKQLSRAIGRNDAYMQQFLHRRTPRHLPENARHRLAACLGLDQRQLVDSALFIPVTGQSPASESSREVPFLDVAASAGGGSFIDHPPDGAGRYISFPRQWLQQIGGHTPESLRLISISGDSMAPKLEHDDLVLVDCSQTKPSPPGIFILDDGIGLVAKQIEIIPSSTPVCLQVSSENPSYHSYQRTIDEVTIIGRVIWFGRRL